MGMAMTELPPLPPTVPLTLTIQTPGVPVAGFPCLVVLHLRNPANASKRAGLPVLEDLGPPTDRKSVV